MTELPWYKREPKAFFEGTFGMPFETKAAYGLALDLIYMYGGRLPDRGREIAGQMGLSVRKWNAIRDELIALGKLILADGYLTNPRASEEFADLAEKRAVKAESGRLGGRAKASARARSGDDREIISGLSPDNVENADSETRENNDLGLADIKKVDNGEPKGSPTPARGDGRRKPERKIPDGFPDDEALAKAADAAGKAGANLDVRVQAERFRNHAEQNDRRCRDWDAAFRNWISKAIETAPKRVVSLSSAAPKSSANDEWRRKLRRFRTNEYWESDDGPRPGRPGCRAPPAILAEFGFATPPDDVPPLLGFAAR